MSDPLKPLFSGLGGAFAELARMHVTRLDAAARLILRDHDLARDAVQEGFIRAWRRSWA